MKHFLEWNYGKFKGISFKTSPEVYSSSYSISYSVSQPQPGVTQWSLWVTLGHQRVILDNPGVTQGLPRGHPGVILGSPRGQPGSPWGHPGSPWGHILGHPGAIMGHQVVILGCLGVILGHPGVTPGHPGPARLVRVRFQGSHPGSPRTSRITQGQIPGYARGTR